MSYSYTLRYTFDPRHNSKAKDEKLFEFVKKAKIDDVAFFLNGENLTKGPINEKETQYWLDAVKPFQKRLAQMGVSTSLNPYSTIMHGERGYGIEPEIGYRPFVDLNGKSAISQACPDDPVWRKYLVDRYAQYATIHPKYLWLEDDFRHFNHKPQGFMCFCDHHMKIFQEKLGKKESRAEFVKKMLQPGEVTEERKVYLDQARQEMIETVHQIEAAVHQVSPETKIAQMTSQPEWHAVEGRDWKNLFENEAGAGHSWVARPTLPAYNEVSPIIYGRTFEEESVVTAAYLGPKAELFPELENYMYSPLVKSVACTKMQIITTALLGAKGILLNIFDMIGSGVNPTWNYAEMLSSIKPFLNKLNEHRLPIDKLAGIKILVDQDSGYSIHTAEGKAIDELLPHEKNWASLLSCIGFATSIQPINKETKLENQILAISGQLLRNFDNDFIAHLLEKNVVLLDGESIQVLIDKGLGELLHIKKSKWLPYRSGNQTFEQADGLIIDDTDDPRISKMVRTGNYLRLDYEKNADVKIWSGCYGSSDEPIGPCMTVIDNHLLLMPIDQDPKHGWESEFTTYKQGLLQKMLDSFTHVDYLIGMPNVKLNLTSDRQVAWLSSFTFDDYDEIKWHPAKELTTHAILIKKDGKKVTEKEVEIKRAGDLAIIDEPIHGLETVQLIFN